jgi:hypothetical protein
MLRGRYTPGLCLRRRGPEPLAGRLGQVFEALHQTPHVSTPSRIMTDTSRNLRGAMQSAIN